MAKKFIRITHKTTGARIADGPIGWGITPFEGNLYIRKKFRKFIESLDIFFYPN